MRDRVNSRVFRATSALEHRLERVLGEGYVSRYELVSFSTVPYARIRSRVRRQRLRIAALAGLAVALGWAVRRLWRRS